MGIDHLDENTVKTLRWILFLPAALVAGMIASAVFRFVAHAYFPELVEVLLCGVSGAVAIMLVGLKVAPRETAGVKWTLIIVIVLLGGLASFGALLGPDKLQALTGLMAVVAALAFAKGKPENRPSGHRPPNPYVDAGTALLHHLITTLNLPGWKDLLPSYTPEEAAAIQAELSNFQKMADAEAGEGAQGSTYFHPGAASEIRRVLIAQELCDFAERSWRYGDEMPEDWRAVVSTYLKSWVSNFSPVAVTGA